MRTMTRSCALLHALALRTMTRSCALLRAIRGAAVAALGSRHTLSAGILCTALCRPCALVHNHDALSSALTPLSSDLVFWRIRWRCAPPATAHLRRITNTPISSACQRACSSEAGSLRKPNPCSANPLRKFRSSLRRSSNDMINSVFPRQEWSSVCIRCGVLSSE